MIRALPALFLLGCATAPAPPMEVLERKDISPLEALDEADKLAGLAVQVREQICAEAKSVTNKRRSDVRKAQRDEIIMRCGASEYWEKEAQAARDRARGMLLSSPPAHAGQIERAFDVAHVLYQLSRDKFYDTLIPLTRMIKGKP